MAVSVYNNAELFTPSYDMRILAQFLPKAQGHRYIDWKTFPVGSVLNISKFGQPVLSPYDPNAPITPAFGDIPTSQIQLSLNMAYRIAWSLKRAALEDSQLVQALNGPWISQIFQKYEIQLDADLFRTHRQQNDAVSGLTNLNLIDGQPHRWAAGDANVYTSSGKNMTTLASNLAANTFNYLTLNDLEQVKLSYISSAVPGVDGGMIYVGFISPLNWTLLSQANIVTSSTSPTRTDSVANRFFYDDNKVLQTGTISGQFDYCGEVKGIHLFQTVLLDNQAAGRPGVSGTGTANIFFGLEATMGAMRRSPESWADTYDGSKEEYRFICSSRYGLRNQRPESLITIISAA